MLQKYFPPPRPTGVAPFGNMARWLEWCVDGRDGPCPVRLITRKYDGMQVVVAEGMDGRVRRFTKSGLELTTQTRGKMGRVAEVLERLFADVRPSKVRHPEYGRAIALFAELAAVREDAVARNTEYGGVLDDLQAIFHLQDLDGRRFMLKVFWCSFRGDGAKGRRAPWAVRLEVCRRCLGAEYVVPTLFDAREAPVAEETVRRVEECYRFDEGLVMELADGKMCKDKALRPVDLLLVAVGLTDVDGARLPTHFYWAAQDGGIQYVPFVADRSHLFQPGRAGRGKVQLSARDFATSGGRLFCRADHYQAHAYNALLGLMGDAFVTPVRADKRVAEFPGGRRIVIAVNRSMEFVDDIRFLARPARGVVGCNQLWMTGGHASVAGVHFQAPLFLASAAYGEAVYQRLLDRPEPTPAATIVALSTVVSRDLREHARAVYGDPVDLIYGDERDCWTPCSTPRSSTTSDEERFNEVEGESDPEPMLEEVRKRRRRVNAGRQIMIRRLA